VDVCPVKSVPFKYHPGIQASQTVPRNKPQKNQTRQLLAMIHTWNVSSLMKKSSGSKVSYAIAYMETGFHQI